MYKEIYGLAGFTAVAVWATMWSEKFAFYFPDLNFIVETEGFAQNAHLE